MLVISVRNTNNWIRGKPKLNDNIIEICYKIGIGVYGTCRKARGWQMKYENKEQFVIILLFMRKI